jgi:hypothetical protein
MFARFLHGWLSRAKHYREGLLVVTENLTGSIGGHWTSF